LSRDDQKWLRENVKVRLLAYNNIRGKYLAKKRELGISD
jgi:hypothetical protein